MFYRRISRVKADHFIAGFLRKSSFLNFEGFPQVALHLLVNLVYVIILRM
jgi:hypothetical protein